MKRLAVLFLVALAGWTTGCKESSPDEATGPLLATATEQAELNVEGMHCATCPVTVNTAAAGVSGVTAVRVSMDEAKAWVSYDPARTSPDAIAAAITGSGYPATPVPAQ